MSKLIVQPQYFTFADDQVLTLKSGEILEHVTVCYETYGQLNADRSNAILLCHALTGDHHAAGYYEGATKPGWWDGMIGPGKAFDTDRFFVICSNVLGSCKGTTGPASINPKTQKPYGLSFPVVTIEDMVDVQVELLNHLHIDCLYSCAGGSMGGLQVLLWAVKYPKRVRSAILIACNYKHTAQQIALHEVARQAIMHDPHWNNGDYYGRDLPASGMAISRMIGHITYMSESSMEKKFGRRLIGKEQYGYDFNHDFEVEGYLKYRGESFVNRFDANSYLYLSKALDYFNLAEEGDIYKILSRVTSDFLIISFSSDWLYPPGQSREMVKALRANDVDVTSIEINTGYGHDSFLVEIDSQSRLIKNYLNRVKM